MSRVSADAIAEISVGNEGSARGVGHAPNGKPLVSDHAAELLAETYGIDDLHRRPKGSWVVRNLIPKHGIGVVWGGSSTYKTFLIIDLICRLASGLDVWGRPSQKTRFGYLYGEGGSGIDRRFDAWLTRHQGQRPEVHFLPRTPPLAEPYSWAHAVAEWATGLGLQGIVIDTAARAFGAADENKAIDMGRFVASLGVIQRAVGLVIVIHHAGIDQSRMRGSSSLYAAADFVLSVKRTGDCKATITNQAAKQGKSKDAEELTEPIAFRLVPVELGAYWVDEDEPKPTSLVAEHAPKGHAEDAEEQKVSDLADGMVKVRAVLHKGQALTEESAMSYSTVRTAAGQRFETTRGAVDELVRRHEINEKKIGNGAKYWLPPDPK